MFMSRRSSRALVALMRATPAVQLTDLRASLGGAGRSTVFRYLEQIPYRSSCSHNGSYYALHDPDRYDGWGLFSAGDVHFSIDGTAKATATRLVRESEAGWTPRELQDLMHTRVQLFLLAATREGGLDRARFGRLFVYFHADPEVRAEQRRRRQELLQVDEVQTSVDDEVVIRVLLVMLRHPGARPGEVVRHLKGRSPPITRDQVDLVFTRYGLGEEGGPRIYFVWVTDLRPKSVRDGISAGEESQARALLAAAAAAGADAFEARSTYEVRLSDDWTGVLSELYAIDKQTMTFTAEVGAWSARIAFADGPAAGDTWGIQDMAVYHQPKGGAMDAPTDREISFISPASFIIPAYKFFYEAPWQLRTATVVAPAGEVDVDGQLHDRVFATWNKPEGHRGADQYLVDINRDTGRIERLTFTLRDFGPSAVGGATFADFVEVDGVTVPGTVQLFGVMPGLGWIPLHRMSFEQPTFDGVTAESLRPAVPVEGFVK